MRTKISIVGCAGVPANYGGFETLAENLCVYQSTIQHPGMLSVYCSSKGAATRLESFNGCKLYYLNIDANGIGSIAYDILSIFHAIRRGTEVLLILGVSGTIAVPFVRLFSTTTVITNIDGIEWRRSKWGTFAKIYLRIAEWFAVRFSHVVISDNRGIADYVRSTYRRDSETISYGGDHAIAHPPKSIEGFNLPVSFAFGVCRIEPENNIELILSAFSNTPEWNIVLVGNWISSEFGRNLQSRYHCFSNIYLLDPIYDAGILRALREQCTAFIHGHSAGGTNPSLVEAMHFGKAILAFDCNFNRYSTADHAWYFSNTHDLELLLQEFNMDAAFIAGQRLKEIAIQKYTWDQIGRAYFDLFEKYSH
jgi:glycosyltransferase involved in cell wall biosynthesis